MSNLKNNDVKDEGPLRIRGRYGETSKQKVSERKEKIQKRSKHKKGGIAKGCGRVMSNRRKKTKYV